MEEILPLIDFSKVKKKKRTKPKKDDEEENNDLEDVVLTKKKDKKKKNKKEEKSENTTSEITENVENSPDIYGVNLSYDFLLNRIYTFIKEHNPNSSIGGVKMKFPTPQLNLVGKTRTCWMNFNDFVEVLNRPIDHLFKFILAELGVDGTIGGKNQANLKGRVTQSTLQKIISKYINDYVRCPNCKSFNTVIKKDQSTRLQQIYCEDCKTVKTIQVIKSRVKAGKK